MLTFVSRKNRSIVCGSAAIILLVLATLTWRQTKVWHDTRTLWQYVITVEPASSIAADALGKLSEAEGNDDQALEFYRGFLKQKSDDRRVRFDAALAERRVGEIYGFLGNWTESLEHHRQSTAILRSTRRFRNEWASGRLTAIRGQSAERIEWFAASHWKFERSAPDPFHQAE